MFKDGGFSAHAMSETHNNAMIAFNIFEEQEKN